MTAPPLVYQSAPIAQDRAETALLNQPCTMTDCPGTTAKPCVVMFTVAHEMTVIAPAADDVICRELEPECAWAAVFAIVSLLPGIQFPLPPSNPAFWTVRKFATGKFPGVSCVPHSRPNPLAWADTAKVSDPSVPRVGS